MMWLRSKVGPRGQTVIPKPAREQLGLLPGDEILVAVEGDHLIVRRKQEAALDAWRAFVTTLPKRRLPARLDFDAQYDERLRKGGV